MSTVTVRKKTYTDKLKDPRWQKKRLKILERDGWKCTCCEEDKETLEIHHLVYHFGFAPWEYDDSELITFCSKCHKFEHSLLTLAKVGIHLDSAGI
jgi:5-methylcytosine-specific restriction endonuclease McrA